jgi:hypothetical protein
VQLLDLPLERLDPGPQLGHLGPLRQDQRSRFGR